MDGLQFFPAARAPSTILPIPNTNDTEARLAITPELAQEAYSIRHKGYLSYGYITPREGGVFFDKYDRRQNERTVLLYRGGVAAATIRICLYDQGGTWPEADQIPAMEIFGDEIRQIAQNEVAEGRAGRVLEITRFARDPGFANDRSLIIAAFRIVAYLRLYFGATVMLNAVRPHHMPMYRRLGFNKLEEPRQYPNLTYCAGLMAMFQADYPAALKKIGFAYGVSVNDPIYASLIAGERVGVFEAPAEPVAPYSLPGTVSGEPMHALAA